MAPASRLNSILGRLKYAFSRSYEEPVWQPIGMSYAGARDIPALFKPEQSLDAFGDTPWLYRPVLSIAMEIASIDFKLRVVKPNGEFEFITEHQALETMRYPQPTAGGKSMLSAMDLKLITAMHMMLNGEAFWLLDKRLKTGRAPTRIRPLLAQHMQVSVSDDGEIIEYVYRCGGKEQTFDPMDIVHFKLPDPKNFYRGHSPVQSIRYAIDTHRKADVMNTSKLDNYSSPSGTLDTEQVVPPDERERILGEFTGKYGGPKNAGKTAMLPRGLKFTKTQESNQDMQYAEGKAITQREILSNYGVGPEILGQTDSVTRANAEATIFVFMRFGVRPFLLKYNDTLNNDFICAFPNPRGAEFFHDDPVPENMEEKRANMTTAFGVGAVTPNEVRKALGMEPLDLPGMDVPYLDMGKTPVDQVDVPIEPDPLTV